MDDVFYYDAIELLQQLIATPSISRDEAAAASVFENFARKNMPGKVLRAGNNIIVLPLNSDQDKQNVLLNSHIDTVKPVAGWTKDPFTPTMDYDTEKLYGLGSNDAGASLVSLAAAYQILADSSKYNLIFVASAEEEVSGKSGFESIISQLPKIDFAIVGEPTDMQPAIAEKGLMVLDGEANGISGHAARNEGVNAIYKAIPAITALSELKLPNTSKTLGNVKISVTQINAGTQHNVVPDKCSFVVDVRTTDAYSNIETLNLIKKSMEPFGVTLTPRSTRLNPSSFPENHPIISRLKLLEKMPFGSSTLSDQALMPWASFKLGPGSSSRSHTADEFIILTEIREAIEIYVKILST